jgi:hypothetical protein
MRDKKWGVLDMRDPKLIDGKMYYQIGWADGIKPAFADLMKDMTGKFIIQTFDIQDLEIRIKEF